MKTQYDIHLNSRSEKNIITHALTILYHKLLEESKKKTSYPRHIEMRIQASIARKAYTVDQLNGRIAATRGYVKNK